MDGLRCIPWWACGLIGSGALLLATAHNAVREIWKFFTAAAPWHELPLFLLELLGIGFVCGCAAWGVRRLFGRTAWVGDAVTGVAVGNLFFLFCMTLFDPAMLTSKPWWVAGSMFSLSTAAGLVLGVWVGHDLRKG